MFITARRKWEKFPRERNALSEFLLCRLAERCWGVTTRKIKPVLSDASSDDGEPKERKEEKKKENKNLQKNRKTGSKFNRVCQSTLLPVWRQSFPPSILPSSTEYDIFPPWNFYPASGSQEMMPPRNVRRAVHWNFRGELCLEYFENLSHALETYTAYRMFCARDRAANYRHSPAIFAKFPRRRTIPARVNLSIRHSWVP